MKKTYFILLFLLVGSIVQAQRPLVDEWEASIGYLNFQGDYGQRGHFSTTLGNTGGMIGAKIYFSFLDSDRTNCYSCKHIKFNLALNTGYSTLNFNRAYEDVNSNVLTYTKIRAFNGQVYFMDLAGNVEYHIKDLRNIDFFSNSLFNKMDPYVGLGIGVLFYGVDVDSELGNYEKNPEILPSPFIGGVYSEPGIVPSVNIEVGLRYQITQELQLNFNNKWMYFMSDKVDGVVPNPEMVDNLYNDWLFSPSLGVVIFIW